MSQRVIDLLDAARDTGSEVYIASPVAVGPVTAWAEANGARVSVTRWFVRVLLGNTTLAIVRRNWSEALETSWRPADGVQP